MPTMPATVIAHWAVSPSGSPCRALRSIAVDVPGRSPTATQWYCIAVIGDTE